MANEAFVLRIPPSGPDMPPGTPGYVLTVQADGVSVAPEPGGGGGGGSVTPLTAALTVDAGGTATTETGAFSGDKAFKTLQPAIDALAPFNGGRLLMAPGSYAGAFTVTEQTTVLEGLGPQNGVAGCFVNISGSFALDASDAQCSLTLQSMTSGADVSDSGTGADFGLIRASINAVAITGTFRSQDGIVASTCAANQATCTGSQIFDAANFSGSAALERCLFVNGLHLQAGGRVLNTIIQGGAVEIDQPFEMELCDLNSTADTHLFLQSSGTSRIFGSVFLSNTVWGTGAATFEVRGSTFSKALQINNAAAALKMWDCVYDTSGGGFSISGNSLYLNTASELNALLAGVDIGVTIHALDLGQGGDAFVLNATQSVVFTGDCRGFVPTNLSGDITLTFDPTASLGLRCFFVDCYHTAHTVTLKVGALTLGTVAANTAGHAVRITMQVTSDALSVALVARQKLVGT